MQAFLFSEAQRTPTDNLGLLCCAVLGGTDKPGTTAGPAGVRVLTYSANANLPGVPTTVNYPDFGSGPGGPIRVPGRVSEVIHKSSWSRAGNVLKLAFNGALHTYQLADKLVGLWKLTSRPGVLWAAGYGYLSDGFTIPAPLTVAGLGDSYLGAATGWAAGAWHPERTWGFNPYLLRQYSRNVLALREPPDQGMLVFEAALLNYAPASRLIMFSSGGHDFDHDGRADDFGHTSILWGAWDASHNRVRAVVGVECSYQVTTPLLGPCHAYCVDDWVLGTPTI